MQLLLSFLIYLYISIKIIAMGSQEEWGEKQIIIGGGEQNIN
jgi:hypothetical protein